jgi:hypothetical protein
MEVSVYERWIDTMNDEKEGKITINLLHYKLQIAHEITRFLADLFSGSYQ